MLLIFKIIFSNVLKKKSNHVILLALAIIFEKNKNRR